MRDSFSKQVSVFEGYLGIKKGISGQYKKLDDLVEVFERRNLFAHADGVVNGIYLNNVENSDKNIGDRLSVGSKYFSRSIINMYDFGAKLVFVAWRRQCPDDLEQIDQILGEFCYDLVEARQYELAEQLLLFSMMEAKPIKMDRQMMNVVNLENCYRLQGDEKKSKEVLDSVDWSAARDEFQICVSAIKGDVLHVTSLMPRISEDTISAHNYESWPAFYRVREDERFAKSFEELFGRPFSPAAEDRHSFMQLMSLVHEDEERAQLGIGEVALPVEDSKSQNSTLN